MFTSFMFTSASSKNDLFASIIEIFEIVVKLCDRDREFIKEDPIYAPTFEFSNQNFIQMVTLKNFCLKTCLGEYSSSIVYM